MPDPSSAYIAPSWSRLGPAFALLALAACASDALDRTPPAPDRPWHPATTLEGEIIPGSTAPAGSEAPRGYVLPSNPAAATLPPSPAIDAERAYGLADLIDLAEMNNPTTRIAWNEARNAALAAGLARSTYLPRISATALGGVQTSRGGVYARDLRSGSDNTATGGVGAISLQWLLFDFGERAAAVKAADQGTVIADIQFTAAHQQLIEAVSLAYYAYVAERARVETAAQSLGDARDVEAAANARYAHGIGTVIEVAQARQATAQAKLAQVQAQGAERDAYSALMVAVGLSPFARITLAPLPAHPLSPALLPPIEQLVSASLARRPDVLAAYAAEKAAAARVDAAGAAFRPKVFASGSVSYGTGDLAVTPILPEGYQAPTLDLSNRRLGASAMVGVTIPLFDGGQRKAALDRARIDADTARLTSGRVKEEAVRQIVQAQNGLRTSLEAYAAAQSLLDAARTTYDAALDAYRNEVGSATDVLMAERALLEARNALTAARSASLSAAATLALATGELGSAPVD